MITKTFTKELLENESLLKQINKHMIVHIYSAVYTLIFLISCGMIISQREGMESILGNGLFWGLFSMFIIICSTLLLGLILSNILDTLIITNKRVFFTRKTFPFIQEIVSISLSEISELKSESTGILATLLSYGDIVIGYKGGIQYKKFAYTHIPSQTVHYIHELKEKDKNPKKVA